MSIYHICTSCRVNPCLTPNRCPARENPHDKACIDNERFVRLEMQKRNRQYYRGKSMEIGWD